MTLLVHERMVIFSPVLAATIGLEESILLYQLHDLGATLGVAPTDWCGVERETLTRLLPFWSDADLQRIAASLAAKGVAQVEPAAGDATQLRFRLAGEPHGAGPTATARTAAPAAGNTQAAASPTPYSADTFPSTQSGGSHFGNTHSASIYSGNTHSANTHAAAAGGGLRSGSATLPSGTTLSDSATRPGGATLLGADWQPQQDTLHLLALKNIPRAFAIEQLEEFVLYWRERGRAEFAWDNKFRKHVVERWQRHLQTGAAAQAPAATPDAVWYPSVDALQILERTGINREFIEDTIPEFVLYWRERGDNTGTWNSKFIAHIRRQWARYSNALEHDQEPRPIAANWQPSEDVYDILRMANIDIGFACELLPEFILFWRDAGTPQRSWNTKFLQHIKYQWATRHHLTGANRAHHSIAAGGSLPGGAAAPATAFERLTDRSWASGLVEGV